ncbi:acetamidase/formamidase family protein [Amycolatopsis pigmentata]|uniref:Acetamidase/formamidase family protein n=1 Tax=Amycolatopsis pigmentata TaxID=450801 RepID=A0ABW5FYN7_9PSEU
MNHKTSTTHRVFDRETPIALTIDDGDTVDFECPSIFDWGPNASVDDLMSMDFVHPHILTGPVAIRGAEPGDALAIDILDVRVTTPQGVTAFMPGFGLLADDFDEAHVHVVRYVDKMAEIKEGVRVPLEPFLGIMGVAPAEFGEHSTIPPRPIGGNLDNRHFRPGTRLILPVEVSGALFSCGDGHAAQGDGEVCGTAVETSVAATLRFHVLSGQAPSSPRAVVSEPLERTPDRGHLVTTGIGDDLHEGARQAVRQMIGLLVAERGLTRQEAYVLCSVAADLKISEIVNEPNWIVSAYLPLTVFTEGS